MRQVRCILGPCSKDFSVLTYVLHLDHLSLNGNVERIEIVNQRSCVREGGVPGKSLKTRVAASLL